MALSDYIRDVDPWHRRVADILDNGFLLWCGTSGGTGNDYDLSPTIGINSYRDGALFLFYADKTNTGACTGSVDGQATIAIEDAASNALGAGEITANRYYLIIYNASSNEFRVVLKGDA